MNKEQNIVEQQIPSLFVDIDSFETFKGLKLAADETNNSYVIWGSDEPVQGTPDILWNEVSFIGDSKYIYARRNLFCKPEPNTVDILEYGSDIEGITDENQRNAAKINYVIDNFVNCSTGDHDITGFRVKKVIKQSDFLNKTITFGPFKAETRGYSWRGTSSDVTYQKQIFKVTTFGHKHHPDTDTDQPKEFYFEYEIAWEDRESEWKEGDLVFYKKYSTWFMGMSNVTYGAPKYILRAFDSRYSDKDLRRKIKSEIRRLTKNLKVSTPEKCTIQSPFIKSGESSLVCTYSSYHMPIYVLNKNGKFQTAEGIDFVSSKNSDARGNRNRYIHNAVDETQINLDELFLLEKFTQGREEYASFDTGFFCHGMNSSVWERLISNADLPYVFLKVAHLGIDEYSTEGEHLQYGALIAVHLNNIIPNGGKIEHIHNIIGGKYSVYVPLRNMNYVGCVITNTAKMPICSNTSNSYCVTNNALDMRAYINKRCGDEFVKVKKDLLNVNPFTGERYINPNNMHREIYFKDFLSGNTSVVFKKSTNYFLDFNVHNKSNSMTVGIRELMRMIADRVGFTTYVYMPNAGLNADSRKVRTVYHWNRLLFNRRGNFKSGSVVFNGYGRFDMEKNVVVVPGTKFDEQEGSFNQNDTWKTMSASEYDYSDTVATYLIFNIFGIRISDDDINEYMFTRLGALDALNNEKTKYLYIAIYPNYISKMNKKSLKTKHERRGILVKLTLNQECIKQDNFSNLVDNINNLTDGSDSIMTVAQSIFQAKVIGKIDFPNNFVGKNQI